MDDKVKITFDADYRVRVYDEAKFKKSEELEKECSGFLDKIGTFSDKVNALVEVLESHATRIDAQKLKAIGSRMTAENEEGQRHRQQRAMQAIIGEKKAELDRYISQYQSLERIEAEQKVLLEKLTAVDIGESAGSKHK